MYINIIIFSIDIIFYYSIYFSFKNFLFLELTIQIFNFIKKI
jgi:hypothetical protein